MLNFFVNFMCITNEYVFFLNSMPAAAASIFFLGLNLKSNLLKSLTLCKAQNTPNATIWLLNTLHLLLLLTYIYADRKKLNLLIGSNYPKKAWSRRTAAAQYFNFFILNFCKSFVRNPVPIAWSSVHYFIQAKNQLCFIR